MADQQKSYYTSSQACRALGLHPNQLKVLVDNGEITRIVPPHHKKRGLYPVEQVEQAAATIKGLNQAS